MRYSAQWSASCKPTHQCSQVIVQGLESLGLAQIWEGHSHFESVECRFETLSEQMIWIGGVGGVERASIHGSDI